MEALFILWVAANVLSWFFIGVILSDDINLSFVNPIIIYDSIKVNWFGAWFLAIVCNVGLPSVAIPYWIYKVCTVGRDQT